MADERTETTITEFEDGAQLVETVTTASEYVEPDETSELVAEAIEPATNPDVEIARIQAERDIVIAAIESETIQAEVEAQPEEGETEWRVNIERQLAENNQRLADLAALLTPPPSPQEPASPQGNPASESNEVTPDSPAAADPAPEPPKRPKKSRWI